VEIIILHTIQSNQNELLQRTFLSNSEERAY